MHNYACRFEAPTLPPLGELEGAPLSPLWGSWRGLGGLSRVAGTLSVTAELPSSLPSSFKGNHTSQLSTLSSQFIR